MFQGTASHVGKSVLTTAFCRLLHRRGVRVAPFKAVNMSNNAWVTQDGGEIAYAQAVQAKACGLDPTVEMNPVLLKPTGQNSSQLILKGRVRAMVPAQEYPFFRDELNAIIQSSLEQLLESYEFVVIEGAGSPDRKSVV